MGKDSACWNIRKCSAAGLDVLSTVFGEELLPFVTPTVRQRLQVGAVSLSYHKWSAQLHLRALVCAPSTVFGGELLLFVMPTLRQCLRLGVLNLPDSCPIYTSHLRSMCITSGRGLAGTRVGDPGAGRHQRGLPPRPGALHRRAGRPAGPRAQ